jgi:hypothetical protein
VRPFFLGREITSDGGAHAHDAEERCGNEGGYQLLGPLDAGPVDVDAIEGGDFFEDAVVFADAVVIGGGADVFVIGAGALADPIDAIGGGIGERADEDGVPDAEDGGVGADADGEGQGGGEDEQGIAAEIAKSGHCVQRLDYGFASEKGMPLRANVEFIGWGWVQSQAWL